MGVRRLLITVVVTAAAASATRPVLAAQQASPQSSQPAPTQSSAQSTGAPADVDKLPISLDRIREQLAREPVFSANALRAMDIPVFRTETKSDFVFRPDPNFWRDNDVAPYARPSVNKWQYDFMKMTNPNLPTGYGPGGGADVLPALTSAFTGIRHAFQQREDAKTRQQIKEELRQINEARRAAGLPPYDESATTPTDPPPQQPAPQQQPQASQRQP